MVKYLIINSFTCSLPMSKPLSKTWLWLTVFSIAMGFLETAVVVYLRELYYPEGFRFPLAPIKPSVAITELLREAATLIMLLAVGILAGRTAAQRFSFAVFSFAIWDIFYYVFLWLLLGWPESLCTWDILFLIPVPWVGPVLAPVLISLTMTALAVLAVQMESRGYRVRFAGVEKSLWATGCVVVLASFTWEYLGYVDANGQQLWAASNQSDLFSEAPEYIPQYFNWWLFGLGEGLLLTGIGWWMVRTASRSRVSRSPVRGKAIFVNPDAEDFRDYLNGL